MERREFLEKSGCCLTGLAAGPLSTDQEASQTQQAQPPQTTPPPKPARYKFDIEIFEARADTWCHKKGEKFEYPKDMAKICPWLMSCMHDFLIVLQSGANLNWKYAGTPYEKVIDAQGVTTEFIRCPDPTSNLVAKITRTKIA